MIHQWINFKAIPEYRSVIASAGYKAIYLYFIKNGTNEGKI